MSERISLPKWTELLVVIYNTPEQHRYCGRMHKKTGMTIRHLRNLIVNLERRGFISRKGGRKIKYITLTETGIELAENLLRIYPKLR